MEMLTYVWMFQYTANSGFIFYFIKLCRIRNLNNQSLKAAASEMMMILS